MVYVMIGMIHLSVEDNGVNDRMMLIQLQNPIYGDRAYDVRGAYHGPHVTEDQRNDNHNLSPERIAVERGFWKVKSRCLFIKQASLLKLQGMVVVATVHVATIYTR